MSSANPAIKSFADEMTQAVEAMGQAPRSWAPAIGKGRFPPNRNRCNISRAPKPRSAIFRLRSATAMAVAEVRDATSKACSISSSIARRTSTRPDRNPASPEQQPEEMEETLAKLEELARRQQELADQRQPESAGLRAALAAGTAATGSGGVAPEDGADVAEPVGRAIARETAGAAVERKPGVRAIATRRHAIFGDEPGDATFQEAVRDMRNAGASQQQGSPQSEAEARRAAERLRDAREMLAGERKQQAAQEMNDLAHIPNSSRNTSSNSKPTCAICSAASGQPELGAAECPAARNIASASVATSRGAAEAARRTNQERRRDATAARDMAGSQPSASTKLREALGEMQQQELRLKMKWSLEIMRRGLAEYALPRELAVTQGLNQLRDRLREAQGALESASSPARPGHRIRARPRRAVTPRIRTDGNAGQKAGSRRQRRPKKGESGGQKGEGQQPGSRGQQGQGQEVSPGDQPGEMAQGQGSQSER